MASEQELRNKCLSVTFLLQACGKLFDSSNMCCIRCGGSASNYSDVYPDGSVARRIQPHCKMCQHALSKEEGTRHFQQVHDRSHATIGARLKTIKV